MKKILIAVCGKTPQIITETLFALWERGDFPDVIYILTTKAGKEAINSSLLDTVHGMFYKFCLEYNIDSSTIDFSSKNIIVPRNLYNKEMEDIKDEEDSRIFLEHCLETTFEHTQNPEDVVFFSIAAGRKTMGASLTLAAQYYGRPQDRMFHVLVHEDFEYSPYFFYPPKKEQFIELKNPNGELYHKSTKYAKIYLVNIPFFSIRDTLSSDMFENPVTPAELLARLQRSAKPCLKLNIENRTIEWKNKKIELQATWFALYWFIIQKKKENASDDNTNSYLELDEILSHSKEIASFYSKVIRYLPNKETPQSNTGILELSADNFRSYSSKVKSLFEAEFGTDGASKIIISPIGKKPNTRYGIALEHYLIEVIDENYII